MERTTLIPSGVSDHDGTIGAVESTGGRIDVLDLRTGKRVARSDGPMTALFLAGESLLAWKRESETDAITLEQFRIEGSALVSTWTCTPALPDWTHELAASLAFKVEKAQDTFVIAWKARRVRPGGMVRTKAYERAQDGLLRIDEQTGAIVNMEEHEAVPEDPQDAYDRALELDLIPVRMGAERVQAPWSTRGHKAFLTRRGRTGDEGVFLRSYSGAESAGDGLEAALPDDAKREPVVTMDGAFVLFFSGSAWDLFSTADGRRKERLPVKDEIEEVAVFESWALYAVDQKEGGRVRRTLHAFDLKGKAPKWSYDLYDKKAPPDPLTIPESAPSQDRPPSMPGALGMPGTPNLPHDEQD